VLNDEGVDEVVATDDRANVRASVIVDGGNPEEEDDADGVTSTIAGAIGIEVAITRHNGMGDHQSTCASRSNQHPQTTQR
jgi:hypothetical protein